MIYVDTNVVMYAVGRAHPLREQVQARLAGESAHLGTSAETLQELLHAYLPVGRDVELTAAFRLVTDRMTVFPVDADDVRQARLLAATEPGLGARDLVHLAIARRRSADELWTYDRGLAAAWA